MSTLNQSFLSLADVYKREEGGSRKAARIIEMLAETNDIMQDATTIECNDGSSHISTQRTGLPEGQFRLINRGVKTERSQTEQAKDACGMLEAYSEVDKRLVMKAKSPKEFRMSEARSFIHGMGLTMAETVFYGNLSTSPEKFMGLAPRFSSIEQTDKTKPGYNVIDAGGEASDNTSIWMVTFGEGLTNFIHPENTKAGFQHTDLGEDTLKDANGNSYQGYRDHFTWDLGLAVEDWRYNGRIANIDVSDLLTAGTGTDTAADLEMLLIDLVERRPSDSRGRTVLYMNKQVHTALRKKALRGSNTQLRIDDFGGKKITMFDTIPLRTCEAILNTEGQVT